MAVTICVASGKGGTGKTSVTAGVAACLSALDHKVLALDCDIGLRNLDLALGLSERAVFDFTDVVFGRKDLMQAAIAHPLIPNLFLLAAPFGSSFPEITAQQLHALMDEIRRRFDFCVIDCPAGIGPWFEQVADVSDQAIMVCTPDHASLRDAGPCRRVLRAHGVSDIRLVLNRVRPQLIRRMRAVNIDDAIDRTGIQLLGIVPEDQTVIACANRGELVFSQMNSHAARAYRNITRRLLGERLPLMKLPRKTV